MKNLLLLLFFVPLVSTGQYSTYYGAYDINANVNIDKNVNVSGNINKTVTTIDYGALMLANAELEKNRLEKEIYNDKEQKRQAIEIANNPIKAFKYSYKNFDSDCYHPGKGRKKRGKELFLSGFQQSSMTYVVPHESLFTRNDSDLNDSGWGYRNVNELGIATSINLKVPYKPSGINDDQKRIEAEKNWDDVLEDVEDFLINKTHKVGKTQRNDDDTFVHKKEVNRTVIFNEKGFRLTLAKEDKYEYYITDSYYAVNNGIIYTAAVKYSGDKDEVTFEDIEGRRHYFIRLMDEIIANQRFSKRASKYGDECWFGRKGNRFI